MTKFSNSGLCKQQFYKKVSDLVYENHLSRAITCNKTTA
jgi:hypothetical protein